MEDYLKILPLVAGIVIGWMLRPFIGEYAKKKGENLATKEDIEDITDKIENTKLEYSSILETTKADLSALLKVHGFRYEKEYEVLSKLSILLVELRDASTNLRPVADFRDKSKSDEEIKKERLTRLNEALRPLYLENENNRPFFPENIYISIKNIMTTSYTESVDYAYRSPYEAGAFMDYWDKAQQNQDLIRTGVEETMALIRSRVSKWDSLQQ